MLRRSMKRAATAVAVAGTICALGAGTALAAPAATWSHPSTPVPGALTDTSPALSSVTFPTKGQGLLVAWRGQGLVGHIFYKYRTPATRRWSHVASVPGALSSSAPAVAGYTDPLGQGALLAVWAGHVNNEIWYSQGETKQNGTVSWTAPAHLPSTIHYSTTFDTPTVFFLDHSSDVMIAWRAPYNHVRYSIGTPAGRGFTWSQSTVIPGNPPSPSTAHCTIDPCTSATPAVTEMTTSTSTGTVYVIWKQLGTKDLFYSSAADSATTNWGSQSIWTTPAQVPGAVTLLAPAASVPTVNSTGPLLLVYKAPFNTHVRYQTLTGSTWSAPLGVYGTRTNVAPALLRNVLGATTPTSIGNVILRTYG